MSNYSLQSCNTLGEKTEINSFKFFRPAVRTLLEFSYKFNETFILVCTHNDLTIYLDGTGSLLRECENAYDILDSKSIERFIHNALKDKASDESPHVIKLRNILTKTKQRDADILELENSYNDI